MAHTGWPTVRLPLPRLHSPRHRVIVRGPPRRAQRPPPCGAPRRSPCARRLARARAIEAVAGAVRSREWSACPFQDIIRVPDLEMKPTDPVATPIIDNTPPTVPVPDYRPV